MKLAAHISLETPFLLQVGPGHSLTWAWALPPRQKKAAAAATARMRAIWLFMVDIKVLGRRAVLFGWCLVSGLLLRRVG